MAKIVKDTRKTIDVEKELEVIKKNTKKKEEVKEKKKVKKEKVKKVKKGFLNEVKEEMSKVIWPSKKDMIKYGTATVFSILFFSGFFYLVDTIMAILLKVGA